MKVMRINEMITNQRSFTLLTKFSLSAPEETYREQYGEYAYWYEGVNGENDFVSEFKHNLLQLETQFPLSWHKPDL